ncbi:MAG: hypothetical protein K2M93_07055 [Muribaculaceae bacterium]|nr:hypothetical protein [Muribaculaceae bacterium]
MIRFLKTTYTFLLLFSLTFLFGGCVYDRFDDFGMEYGDGFADMQVQVAFENLSPALETRAAGDAIGAVNNLQMVIYKVGDNNSVEFYKRVVCSDLNDYKLNDPQANTAEPDDKETGNDQHAGGQFESTGEITAHATFSINDLPYGVYRMYAVANVPGLTDEQCQTEESLRNIQFTWDPNVANNKAMFGYFTIGEQKSANFEAPNVLINKPSVSIHSWIRRLASKVTVAFDPSELKEAVTVYIKSVTLHDIPTTCKLGVDNKPSTSEQLIANGESIDYSNGSIDYNKWEIQLQKGSGKKGSNHSNTANALFFFENKQGDFSNAPNKKDYLKEQIPEETGTSINEEGDNKYGEGVNDFKDRVKYGSYIEVVGYYVSKNSEKMSSGNIKYRFMLGKDIMYNYDAERNYHYKLTLKFRGFANEADWHIVYEEPTPSLYTPDKYYVSYLYGQESNFPVRVVTGDPENTSRYTLVAEIIENPWWPYDEDGVDGLPRVTIGEGTDKNGFAWMKSAVVKLSGSEQGVLSTPYYTGDNANYAGFLSLRKPETVDGKPNVYKDIEFPDITDANQYGPNHSAALKKYYNDKNVAHAAYSLSNGTRNVGLYENGTFTTGSSADGQYTVTTDADGSVSLKLPMFTRPLKMVAASDFTGNNPYPSFMRRAVVRFTMYDEKGKLVSFKDLADHDKEVTHRDVPVLQVRRVENPKAIYRAYDSTEPFDVHLMHRRHHGEQVASSFEGFTSDGPWRASILVDPKGLVKLSKGGTTVQGEGKSIQGSSGTEVQFTYTPNGTCGANETRCAIILVEYHDYTCNHMIFVRQGYDKGVNLAGTNWSLYQVYAAKGQNSNSSYTPEPSSDTDNFQVSVAVTKSPLSIGSYLKRCQYNWSIREAGNPGWLSDVITKDLNSAGKEQTDNYGLVKYKASPMLSVAQYDGTTVTTRTASWTDIQGFGWYNFDGELVRYKRPWAATWNAKIGTQTKQLTVPTYKQYEDLRDQCDFGFGIAYADGATQTATNLDVAYGYIDATNTGVRNSNGMRVCVAYDKSNGNNILFPISKEGHGRRACGGAYAFPNIPNNNYGYNVSREAGVLSYGGLASVLWGTVNQHRPITYNHYRTPGAIYWVKQPYFKSGDSQASYAGWDINYFTLTFNKYAANTMSNFDKSKANATTCSDALPIKLIYKNAND